MTEVFPYVRMPDGLSAPCDALEVCSTYSFKLNFYILFIVESLKGNGLGSTQILFERVLPLPAESHQHKVKLLLENTPFR